MGISIRYEEAKPGVKIKYEQKYILFLCQNVCGLGFLVVFVNAVQCKKTARC